jgi:hypothetical protein
MSLNRYSRIAATVCASLVWLGSAFAQIQIVLPAASFKTGERISAKVVNRGKIAVSYCVEFGQRSSHNGTTEATPIPFHVETRRHQKWGVLMNGPDIGSSRHGVGLEPGQYQEFPFRLGETGDMRLALHYRQGERDDVCSGPDKGTRTARSQVFSVSKD